MNLQRSSAMLFVVLMILSTAVLVFSAFEAIRAGRTYRTNRILTPSRILAIGVFISATLLFFPYYFNLTFSDTSFFLRLWESFWLSVHHAIRLFVVDTDVREFLVASLVFGIDFYAVLGTILLILAPMLTFSVILSFFKNFSAYRKYLLHPMPPTCVFSELNEKSLALAKDFKKHFYRCRLIR